MTDDQAIRAAVQTYLDGLYEGDPAKLEASFLPTSALTVVDGEGKVSVTPRDAWIEAVRNRPSPASSGLARGDEILSVDQSGPTTAFVKVRCQIPPRFFTDYLSFLKVDGAWRVAQKVFSVRTDPQA